MMIGISVELDGKLSNMPAGTLGLGLPNVNNWVDVVLNNLPGIKDYTVFYWANKVVGIEKETNKNQTTYHSVMPGTKVAVIGHYSDYAGEEQLCMVYGKITNSLVDVDIASLLNEYSYLQLGLKSVNASDAVTEICTGLNTTSNYCRGYEIEIAGAIDLYDDGAYITDPNVVPTGWQDFVQRAYDKYCKNRCGYNQSGVYID